MKKIYYTIFVFLLFVTKAAFAQSGLSQESIEIKLVSGLSSLMGPEGAGGKLIEAVILPIFGFCFFMQFIRTMSGSGKAKGLLELTGFGILSLALLGVLDIDPLKYVPALGNISSNGGELSRTLKDNEDLTVRLYALSAGTFGSVARESFGTPEEQEKILSDSIEKAGLRLQASWAIGDICNQPTDSDKKACIKKLMSPTTSIEDIKKMVGKTCEDASSSILPKGFRVFTCNMTQQPMAYIATNIVVPIITNGRNIFIWFFQLAFLMIVILTLIFSKFSFATLPLESQRNSSVKAVKFIIALGSFSFILAIINYFSAQLMNVVVGSFMEMLQSTDDTSQVAGLAIRMVGMILASALVQFVFIMKIPMFIQAISDGAIEQIAQIATDSMQTAVLVGASVLPYIGAGSAMMIGGMGKGVKDIRDKSGAAGGAAAGAAAGIGANKFSKGGGRGGDTGSKPHNNGPSGPSTPPPSSDNPANYNGGKDAPRRTKATLEPGARVSDSKRDALKNLKKEDMQGSGGFNSGGERKLYGPKGDLLKDFDKEEREESSANQRSSKPSGSESRTRKENGQYAGSGNKGASETDSQRRSNNISSLEKKINEAGANTKKGKKLTKDLAKLKVEQSDMKQLEDKAWSRRKKDRIKEKRLNMLRKIPFIGTAGKIAAYTGKAGLQSMKMGVTGAARGFSAASSFAAGDSAGGVKKLKNLGSDAAKGAKSVASAAAKASSDIGGTGFRDLKTAGARANRALRSKEEERKINKSNKDDSKVGHMKKYKKVEKGTAKIQ
jgi:hypothetical protein